MVTGSPESDSNITKERAIVVLDTLNKNITKLFGKNPRNIELNTTNSIFLTDIKSLIDSDLDNVVDLDYLDYIINETIELNIKALNIISDNLEREPSSEIMPMTEYIYPLTDYSILSNESIELISQFNDFLIYTLKQLKIYCHRVNQLQEENIGLNIKLQGKINAKTTNIYNETAQHYASIEKKYRKAFNLTITAILAFSLFLISIMNKEFDYVYQLKFWSFKITAILVGITLLTYFIKQASHYQKLSEKNRQTHIELLAFPSFVSEMSQNDINDIRKNLSSKYFGQEFDSSPHKEMSNLISDQMKNATELVKASAAVVKSINQPTTKPTEPKPKDSTTQ